VSDPPVVHTYRGRCHCRNLEFEIESSRAPEALPLRACQCTFCRAHGARTATDREGRARLVIRDTLAAVRYRFGLRTADYLVCARCGVYVAAIIDHAGRRYATFNMNAVRLPALDARVAEPATCDGETAEARRARRVASWTPVEEIRYGSAA